MHCFTTTSTNLLKKNQHIFLESTKEIVRKICQMQETNDCSSLKPSTISVVIQHQSWCKIRVFRQLHTKIYFAKFSSVRMEQTGILMSEIHIFPVYSVNSRVFSVLFTVIYDSRVFLGFPNGWRTPCTICMKHHDGKK